MQLNEELFFRDIKKIVELSDNLIVRTLAKDRVITAITRLVDRSTVKIESDDLDTLRERVAPASATNSENTLLVFTGFDSPGETAQQFLLKLLEEQRGAKFIFVTSKAGYINTLRSRCSTIELVNTERDQSAELTRKEYEYLSQKLISIAEAKSDEISNEQKRLQVGDIIEKLLTYPNLTASKLESLLICKKALSLNCNIKLIVSQVLWSCYT
jgi:hypothetical protein